MRHRGLTLVEALIVVAVLLTVGCVVCFSMTRAGQTSSVAGCVSNLRQIGAALTLYEADNDGHMPYLLSFDDPGSWAWRRAIVPYVGRDDVLYCPADDRADPARAHKYYSLHPIATSYTISRSVDRFRRSDGSTYEVIHDGGRDPGRAELAKDHMGINRLVCKEDVSGPYHPWYSPHGRSATVLYWDMHVRHGVNRQFTEVAVRLDAKDCSEVTPFPSYQSATRNGGPERT